MSESDAAVKAADFDRAVDPVLADLRATAGPLPLNIGELYEDPGFSLIRDFAGEQGSRGIRMPIGQTPAEQIAFVADEVQGWAVEENWGRASNWPKCRLHPTTHPLQAVVVEGDAVWQCPAASKVIARVGSLVN